MIDLGSVFGLNESEVIDVITFVYRRVAEFKDLLKVLEAVKEKYANEPNKRDLAVFKTATIWLLSKDYDYLDKHRYDVEFMIRVAEVLPDDVYRIFVEKEFERNKKLLDKIKDKLNERNGFI